LDYPSHVSNAKEVTAATLTPQNTHKKSPQVVGCLKIGTSGPSDPNDFRTFFKRYLCRKNILMCSHQRGDLWRNMQLY